VGVGHLGEAEAGALAQAREKREAARERLSRAIHAHFFEISKNHEATGREYREAVEAFAVADDELTALARVHPTNVNEEGRLAPES